MQPGSEHFTLPGGLDLGSGLGSQTRKVAVDSKKLEDGSGIEPCLVSLFFGFGREGRPYCNFLVPTVDQQLTGDSAEAPRSIMKLLAFDKTCWSGRALGIERGLAFSLEI